MKNKQQWLTENDITCRDDGARLISFFINPIEESVMFWTFIIFAIFALMFVKLGAYSVWMAIFAGGLKVAALVIICLVIWQVFQKLFHKSSRL
ncbi:MAG: hypothetical protein HOO92_16715 [Methylococcaceae bacterium]|nr:hypothetical protein [Methylococcaceae bacterium]